MTRSCNRLPSFILMLCVTCVVASSILAAAGDNHRAEVKIEMRTTIVSPAPDLKLKRAMLGMKRHPDGSILINVQTLPVLLRSTDQGKS